jgi:hypothetical protein
MSFDTPQSPENLITVEEVISLFSELREGRGDKEAVLARYAAWCEQEEAKVTDALGITELEIRKAELLIRAGCIPEAYDIADAIYQTAGTELENSQELRQRMAAMSQVFDATLRD